MKKPKKEEKPLSGAQDAYEWLQILIVALVTIILVFTFVGRITPVVGESMLPTLHEGDVMLIRDIGYTDPQPGDIVVLTKEFDAARGPIVKRIIAVEGQTVDIDYQTGTVYVDGEDKVSEDQMVLLARDIAKKIEEELEYPGQIKVNMIRETKVIEYAK